MSWFKAVMKTFINEIEHYGRHRARQQLLMMSDRQLADVGYSRELLQKGVSSWPWIEVPTQIQLEAHRYTGKVEGQPSQAFQEAAA